MYADIIAVLTDAATATKAAPQAEGAARVNPPVLRQPCMMPGEKRLVVQSPQPTIEDALRDFSKEGIEQPLQALNLAEYEHAWTIVGPGVTREQLVKQLKKSYRFSKAHGCTTLAPPDITGHLPPRGETRLQGDDCRNRPLVNGERKCAPSSPGHPSPGRAIIQNHFGAGYNAQSVYLDAPTVGNNQGRCLISNCCNYIAFLNNVLTDNNYFLQAGFVFEGPNTKHLFGEKGLVVWTDEAHQLVSQDLPFDYTGCHTYWTTITLTGEVWWMCALDTANAATYTCNNATSLQMDINTLSGQRIKQRLVPRVKTVQSGMDGTRSKDIPKRPTV